MLHNHVFDLIRIDVEAGDQDHVFLAIDDAQEALVIHYRNITGVQPAVFDDFVGRIGTLPVAQHHLRTFDAKLTRLARRDFVIVIIDQFGLGGRNRQTNASTVIIDIVWVHADQRSTFRQPIAFQQILAGELHPALGDRLLNRHAAARREMQRGEIQLLELFVIKQRVKQGVHPRHGGERIFRQLFHQARDIARVGDEDVLTTQFNKQQAVHGQRKDVIQRKRGDHHLFARMQQRPVGGVHLFKVCQHIAVGEHGPFGDAGGPARILQKRKIFRDHFGFHILHTVARMQRAAEGDGVRQVVFWHQTFDVFDDKVNQRAFGG